MKVKDIPDFQVYIREVIKVYPIYNQAKYFNRLFALFTRKNNKITKLWRKNV